MIMSNFIDEEERHVELYNAYTPRQRFVLQILNASKRVREADFDPRFSLLANGVTESEIHWLERTGRIPSR